jgi:hypothetical protein
VYVCGSIEKLSGLREKALQQGEQENPNFHRHTLAPSGVGVKAPLGNPKIVDLGTMSNFSGSPLTGTLAYTLHGTSKDRTWKLL